MYQTSTLGWLALFSSWFAFLGCGDADRLPTAELTSALIGSSFAAVFEDSSTMRDNSPDWDVNHGKASCAVGEAVSGISVLPGAWGRKALCKQMGNPLFGGNTAALLGFDLWFDQRRFQRLGDWAQGYWKLECGADEYVSGVSENALQIQGNNFFHDVRCSSGIPAFNTCSTRVFDQRDSRGTTLT